MLSFEYIKKFFFYKMRMLIPQGVDEKSRIESERVKDAVRDLDELPEPKTAAERNWTNNRKRIRQFFLLNDPRRFFSCGALRATMIVEDENFTSIELGLLKKYTSWTERWSPILTEPAELAPPPHSVMPRTSANTIHHVFHIATFENSTGYKVENAKLIVEFGGGYGNVCRLAHELGFVGKYVIFDLPEMSILQRFYLASRGISVFHSVSDFNAAESGVLCVTSVDLLMDAIGESPVDVFVATWSLSEAPLDVRDLMVPVFKKTLRFLLAYQERFEDVDNRSYFRNLGDELGLKGKDWEMEFLPGNRYLMLS